jgi:PqqD family protein of HPr-rel-A system
MTEQVRWRAISGFTLHWHTWANEHIVYNAGSGDTHLFNDFAALILRTLQEKATTVEELSQLCATSFKQDEDEELYAQINELLLELDRLGVIERIH